MKNATIFYFATAVSVIAGGGALSPALAAQRQPVVVELFTSQGCSSCPPANANLVKLSKDPSVLALSFAVTYWDYLGWKDSFGKAEFTERQAAYEPPLGQSGSFTPQMVVNGRQSTVGNDMKQIRDIIASAPPLDGPRISLTKTQHRWKAEANQRPRQTYGWCVMIRGWSTLRLPAARIPEKRFPMPMSCMS